MTSLAVVMAATAFGWALVFAVFVYALRKRTAARFESGFFLSLLVALVGVALMSASVVGIWGYQAAKRVLDQELIVELQNVGRIVEGGIQSEINEISDELAGLGGALLPVLDRHATAADLTDRLQSAQSFNPRFLELHLLDAEGRSIAASSRSGAHEPLDRVATAFGLDGKPFVSEPYISPAFKREVVDISLPLREGNGPVRGVIGARYDLQAALARLISTARFNQSGYAVMVDGDGQIIAHPDPKRLDEDVSSYPAVQRARQSRGTGEVVAPNRAGLLRLFVYRAVSNPGTLGKQPWVLLTEINQSEELAPLRRLRRELAFGIVLLLVGSLLVAHQVSRSIGQPLAALATLAHRVGSGDLAARTDVTGKDVAGRLGTTLNEMAAGLEERDHVKEVFGRYIATQVSEQILKGQTNLGGEARTVTILFSDIRNFTGMSEQLSPQQVVAFLNDYFSEMVDAVFDQGGVLDKFMGDGLMAVFGSLGDEPDHPRRAVQAALRMKALLAKINGVRGVAGHPPIAIGIGIHTDEVIVGNIGSRRRLEYTVVGDGVNTTSRLQTLNKEFGTTILISESTYQAVKDEFECRQMPDAPLRGKTKELRFYEVISSRQPAAV